MDNSFCLVVNPSAGGGRVGHIVRAVVSVVSPAAKSVRVVKTSSLNHGAALAVQACQQGETVVAIGGDGLVGMTAAATSAEGGVLGIVPVGRSNDFARMLGVPTKPAQAAENLLNGVTQEVDLIGVRCGDGPEQRVAGSVYLGVPSQAAEVANTGRRWGGKTGYQVAAVRVLAGWRPVTFTVAAEGTGPAQRFRGFAVIVANSSYLAAGKMVAPAADVTDGLLDVVVMREGTKLSFVRAMLRASHGTHVLLSEVSSTRAAAVTVTADRPVPAGADGETLLSASPLTAGSPLRVRALPGALRVITPVRSAPSDISVGDFGP
ncbi:MAG TPA: diacylglycerol kinase family protein [Streptosporangiaceae bacterium]|nr:diacylglycerol kinase family protein [Streptosporangiaceae bacterium]